MTALKVQSGGVQLRVEVDGLSFCVVITSSGKGWGVTVRNERTGREVSAVENTWHNAHRRGMRLAEGWAYWQSEVRR